MRSILHVFAALAMGNWCKSKNALCVFFSRITRNCTDAFTTNRGYYPGTVWYFAGFMGGVLPALLAWTLPKDAWEAQAAEKR